MRGMFPRIPLWVLGVALAVLALVVIPIAASEPWRRIVFMAVDGNPASTLLAVMAVLALGVVAFLLHQSTAMRRELEESHRKLEEMHARYVDAPTTVDYLGANAVVEVYITPALQDMREITRLAVRKDFLDRFDQMTGAKLGPYKYNRALLQQWMESNAARFLVKHRSEMR